MGDLIKIQQAQDELCKGKGYHSFSNDILVRKCFNLVVGKSVFLS